jgi:hypothetical protein
LGRCRNGDCTAETVMADVIDINTRVRTVTPATCERADTLLSRMMEEGEIRSLAVVMVHKDGDVGHGFRFGDNVGTGGDVASLIGALEVTKKALLEQFGE